MAKVSLEKDKIKFLLLEGVHPKAVDLLRSAGYSNIEYHKGALDTAALKEAIRDAHFVGLRSRTQLTSEVIAAAEKLVAIGCFCIGTNQVDLVAAQKRGIGIQRAVLNTRSVAEMVLGRSYCCCVVSLKPMRALTVVSGTRPPMALMKRAARSWGSSVMGISAPSLVFWPKRWG